MRSTVAIVQARMSSRRFPGKVLAPLAGRPVVEHVLRAAEQAVGRDAVVLATSAHASDAPLARYAESIGFAVHRGPLDDTVLRFQETLRAHPAEWLLRICGDSPLLEPALLRRAIGMARADLDLVTNVHPRTFPPGRSVELLRADRLLALDSLALPEDEREHLTLHFYRHAENYRIANFGASPEEAAMPPLAIDTVDDLHRVEGVLAKGARL